jgi:hypothetical protein
MGLFASIALNPAVKCGQNAESGGVGDGGVSSRTTAGPLAIWIRSRYTAAKFRRKKSLRECKQLI